MFGYIKCYKDELQVKNVKKYSSYYCAVCSRIQCKWGVLFRLSLSYDAAFLSIFLDGLKANVESYHYRCPFAPFKEKKLNCNIKVLDYAALINGYLIIKKLEDNYWDEKNWFCGILATCCKKSKGYRSLKEDYPELFLQLEEKYFLYMELENKKQVTSFDEYSESFGNVLGVIWKGIAEVDKENTYTEKEKENLFVFGKILGMWVYTVDALDDYIDDQKKKRFNPLVFLETGGFFMAEKVQKMLILMQLDLLESVKLLDHNRNKDILQNILTYGMTKEIRKIIDRQRMEGK